MGNIYNSLSTLFKRPLYIMADELNYKKSNVYILQNNFMGLKNEFPDVWHALLSCSHNKDNRTHEEYAQDLVASWVYEDTLLLYLKKSGFEINLHGSDKEREILRNSKVSSNADYVVTYKNIHINIELVNSYTPYWERTQRIDLRDNKYQKMKDNKALLLCIDINSKKLYILDFMEELLNSTYIPYHRPYGKPAYQIDISHTEAYELTMKNLLEALFFYFNKRLQ